MSFDLQGHRGCRGLMPENTIPAMLRAVELQVTTLEMDVVITGDSQVLVSHEPFFSHELTTLPTGDTITEAEEKSNIFRMSYFECTKYDVGVKEHPRFRAQKKMRAIKPLLSELIDTVETYLRQHRSALCYNIEIKSTPLTDGIFHPAPTTFCELVMAVVKLKGITARAIIQSFDPRPLQYIHKRWPAQQTSLLVEESDTRNVEQQIAGLGFTPSIYSPEYTKVNKDMVIDCHRRGMKIIPWTVNDSASVHSLRTMGVDGMITDYPDRFR